MSLRFVLLFAVLTLETGYFVFSQTNDIVVREQVIRDDTLVRLFEGLRVVHLSDLHLQRIGVRERRLQRLVAALEPDIVFITGDLIARDQARPACASLMRELVHGSRAVIVVFGNNDHSYRSEKIDTARFRQELEQAGVRVLVNESLKITAGKEGKKRSFYVAGLDDNFLKFDDIFASLRNVPAAAPKVLLAHSPHIVEKVDPDAIRLVLSGHTHGGQIRLPFIGALYLNPPVRSEKKFVSGLYGASPKVHVTRGIGTVMLPIRLFCKPEVVYFAFEKE